MKPATLRFLGGVCGSLALVAASARAEVKLPALFIDHCVLQRDQAVPVWGEAAPGEEVTVKFRAQVKTATADAQGHWKLKLDPLPASAEPQDLVVSASHPPPITIHDVLVGEVWVGSGQSNMAMMPWTFTNSDARLLEIWKGAPYPQIRQSHAGLNNGRWQVATSINTFSALLFTFGLRLHQELGVPVGLIVSAISGSASSCWLSEDALKADAPCQAAIQKYSATFDFAKYDAAMRKYTGDLEQWKTASAEAQAQKQPAPPRPVRPVKPGEGSDGGVGCLYEAWVRPLQPYGIRGVLWDQGESGTALEGVDQYTLMGALIRGWRRDWGEIPFVYFQKPSGGGCGWDPADPMFKFAEPFAPLPASAAPDDNGGSQIYNKIKIMTYPHTGMASSSDLGAGTHPLNKSGYGRRAADVALGMVYGKPVEYYGPIYDSHQVEGATVRVKFQHVGHGLAFKHGEKLQGFAIAGADKVFHWADARIDGDTVVLSSEKVAKPVVVEYAWAAYRPWANLFNKDGLPAVPFRSDQ